MDDRGLRQAWLFVVLVTFLVGLSGAPARAASTAGSASSSVTASELHRAAVREASISVANQDDPTAITFDDFNLETPITNQYMSRGVVFTSPVFISSDYSNPTAPVLSGTPKFFGDIIGQFTVPGTMTPTTVNGFSLDVGFIDDRNSVEIDYYDAAGNPIGSTRAQSFGINEIDVPYRGIASFKVSAVEYEAAGFAIDNLVIHSGVTGIHPARMAEFGDSYSSGEGLLPEKGLRYDCGTDLQEGKYLEGTTVPASLPIWGGGACQTATGSTKNPGRKLFDRKAVTYENLCHRHRRAYPNQIREDLKISSENAIFVACSGATTTNVTATGQYPNSPPGVHGGEPQLQTVTNFAAAHGAPELITIGIGGNDAGFSGIIKHCILSLSSCADPGYASGVLAKVNGTMYNNVKSTLSALTVAFPTATIAAFGYPSVIDDPAQACVPGIDPSEMTWIKNSLLPTINEALRDAATETGVTFIDTTAATLGHGVCSAEPWINGLRAGDDRVKLWKFSVPKVVANESFHPNQKAHDAITRLFIDHYTDGAGNLIFTNPPRETPIRAFSGPEVQTGELEVGGAQPCGAGCKRPVPCIQGCPINIQGMNFDPGVVMNVTLRSDPVVLGQVTADADGRFEATFKPPAGLKPGGHTVSVEGVAANGNSEDGIEAFRIYARSHLRLGARLSRKNGKAVVRRLTVARAAPRSRVDIVCARGTRRTATKALLGIKVRRGGGCPFLHRHVRLPRAKRGKHAKRLVKRNFASLFKQPLAPHTVLRIVASATGTPGKSLDVIIRGRGGAKPARGCTDPGRVIPAKC